MSTISKVIMGKGVAHDRLTTCASQFHANKLDKQEVSQLQCRLIDRLSGMYLIKV